MGFDFLNAEDDIMLKSFLGYSELSHSCATFKKINIILKSYGDIVNKINAGIVRLTDEESIVLANISQDLEKFNFDRQHFELASIFNDVKAQVEDAIVRLQRYREIHPLNAQEQIEILKGQAFDITETLYMGG